MQIAGKTGTSQVRIITAAERHGEGIGLVRIAPSALGTVRELTDKLLSEAGNERPQMSALFEELEGLAGRGIDALVASVGLFVSDDPALLLCGAGFVVCLLVVAARAIRPGLVTERVFVLAAAAAGPAAFVRHEENGMLVPVDDAAALTQALRQVLDRPALRAALCAGGRATYEAQFTRSAVTRQMHALYEKILAEPCG